MSISFAPTVLCDLYRSSLCSLVKFSLSKGLGENSCATKILNVQGLAGVGGRVKRIRQVRHKPYHRQSASAAGENPTT